MQTTIKNIRIVSLKQQTMSDLGWNSLQQRASLTNMDVDIANIAFGFRFSPETQSFRTMHKIPNRNKSLLLLVLVFCFLYVSVTRYIVHNSIWNVACEIEILIRDFPYNFSIHKLFLNMESIANIDVRTMNVVHVAL